MASSRILLTEGMDGMSMRSEDSTTILGSLGIYSIGAIPVLMPSGQWVCPLGLFLPLSPHCLNMSSGSSFCSQGDAGRMFFLSPYLKRIMNHWEKALLLIRLFFSIWGKSNDWNINLIWTVLKYLFFNIDRNFGFAFWFCTFKKWTRKTLNH